MTGDKIDLSAQIKSSLEISKYGPFKAGTKSQELKISARTAEGIHNRLQDSDKGQDDVDDILDIHANASKKPTNCGMLRFVGQRYMMGVAMGIGGLVVVYDNIDKTRYTFFIFTFDNNLLFSRGELKYKKRKRRSGITYACLKSSWFSNW